MAIVHPTMQNFNSIVAEGFWIADFYTTHCGPCKLIDVIINDIVTENPDINWAKCNLDDDESFMERFQILGTPTLLFFLDGELKGKMVGGFYERKEIEAQISQCIYGE